MSINKGIGLVGVALQTDEATAATAPKYAHGLTGGSPISIDRKNGTSSVACGVRTDIDGYVDTIDVSPKFDTYGYADALGLYYFAALGNVASVTTADVTTHTITLGNKLPSLTIFGQVGSDNFAVTSGCKVSDLKMSFKGNEPATFSVTTMGLAMNFLDATPFGSVEPSCFDGKFVPTDGTFKLDTAGSTPAAAIITEGEVDVSNDCEGFRSAGKVMPSSIGEKKCTVKPSFTVVPDDIKPYRKMVTGSETGTVPSGAIVYGSFDIILTHTVHTDWSIEIKGDKVPFSADFPEVDPGGGSGEFKFSADSAFASGKGGTPITVIVKNGVANYTTTA